MYLTNLFWKSYKENIKHLNSYSYFVLKDECSFVSLRDVERVLKVMTWFYIETEEDGFLFNDMAFEEEDIENINVSTFITSIYQRKNRLYILILVLMTIMNQS